MGLTYFLPANIIPAKVTWPAISAAMSSCSKAGIYCIQVHVFPSHRFSRPQTIVVSLSLAPVLTPPSQ